MKPLDFIAAVVPSAGVYCVAELSTKKKQHVYEDSVLELEAAITSFTEAKRDIYFALASFGKKGDRTAANAVYMRSAFLDIDCGEGKAYLNKQAAVMALDAFLQAEELGTLGSPWIVSSGGGLHVYWPFTEDIPIAEWRPVVENFKRLCKKHDLYIDFTVTADAARVLRVPETFNWKDKRKPRAVKVASVGDRFKFSDFARVVADTTTPTVAATFPAIPGNRPKRTREGATQIKLIENSVTKFKNILQRSDSGTGCKQLEYYIENATSDGMEPIWRGLLSYASKCADGGKAAVWLSSLHPYDADRMNSKLREIKGPYPCTKMDSENPGVCTSCVHWGKITNPLSLGREVATDNTEKEVIIETPSESVSLAATQVKITRPTPPRGFSYGRNGGIYREMQSEDENQNKVAKQILVLPYDMFVVDLLNVSGEHTVYMLAMRPEGSIQVILPQKAVVSKDETVKALASQNIIAAYGSGNDKNLFDYVRACVEDVSTNKQAITVPTGYGWQPDNGFVAGSKIFMIDGTVRQIPMPGLENLNTFTAPRGTLENWRKLPQLLTARKEFDILALGLGVGFGSPLFKFSALGGMTFHLGSTESGTGKTLALALAASVWGHPINYRVSKGTSAVAMQQRAGLLNSLPLLCDEITAKSRDNPEWFPEFIFDLSEGRGKERMESGSNRERVNTSTWGLIAMLTSNSHMVDYMAGGRKHSSEGEMRRLLEWTSTKELVWDSEEVDVIRTLNDNYSVAGDIFARWISLNRQLAQTVYKQAEARIKVEFSMTNDERYWCAGTAACLAGYILAGSKYANIVDLPIEALLGSLKRIVDKARFSVRSNKRTAEDVLNSYIREFYGRFINVRAVEGAYQATFGEAGIVDESVTRTQIAGRVERNITPGVVNFYIEEQLLKTYCSSMSFGYSDFRTQISKAYLVDYVKKDMLSKTKGPQMRVNAIKISRPESDLTDTPNNEERSDTLPLG